MDRYIRSPTAPLVLMAALMTVTSGLPTHTNIITFNSTSPKPVFNLESTPQPIQSIEDCLYNQYYDNVKGVCETCTYCPPGTQHSSLKPCGYGAGNNSSCIPCGEKGDDYYQPHTGYHGLKCSRCITCDTHADVLRNCSATHNAKCGPCPVGFYTYAPNTCLPCIKSTDHAECELTQTPSSLDQLTDALKTTDIPLETLDDITLDHQPSPPPPPTHTDGPGDESGGSHKSKVEVALRDSGALIIVIIFVGLLFLGHFINKAKHSKVPSAAVNRASIQQVTYADCSAIPSVSAAEDQRSSLAQDMVVEPSTSRQERESLLGSDHRMGLSVGTSADDRSEAPSLAGLSISGGNVRLGVEMYPQLAIHCPRQPPSPDGRVPGSPDSAIVNFSFEGDDGNSNLNSSHPMALRS